MNLEPLTAVVLSAIALGEVITPLRAVSSGLILAALGRFKSGDDDAVTARSCLERYPSSWAHARRFHHERRDPVSFAIHAFRHKLDQLDAEAFLNR
jgi:hypothetical protein